MYSLDLREKLLKSYLESDLSQHQISRLFGVSRSFLTDLIKRYKDTGNLKSDTNKCGRKTKFGLLEIDYLKSEIDKNNSITLSDLSFKLRDNLNFDVSISAIHKCLKSLNINYKKKHYMTQEKTAKK